METLGIFRDVGLCHLHQRFCMLKCSDVQAHALCSCRVRLKVGARNVPSDVGSAATNEAPEVTLRQIEL